MKDLFVQVADADAQGFIRALLSRPKALGVDDISFDIDRHPLRDPGMIQSGAELARMRKGHYKKLMMLWDHHGSGRDHRQTHEAAELEIQDKLDRFSWSGNSSVIVLVPELEQWLWFCESAMASYYGTTLAQLKLWIEEHSTKSGKSIQDLKAQEPKELFEHIVRQKLRRTISPRDFEEIGGRASIEALLGCDSFRRMVEVLRGWFAVGSPKG